MLQNIQPNRKRSKSGSLTSAETPLVKGLLANGYASQDIVHIVNQGRSHTINLARITEVNKDTTIKPAKIANVNEYIKIQSSYDPKTLLNPYKDARLIRAREAMICSVQIFNNPAIIFKAESFCVLANIAWTYLLHEKMEQSCKGSSIQDDGNSVTLSGVLKKQDCPIKDESVKENLRKIIDIRNAVEHTFFSGGEECFGRLFQACCVNFEKYMTEWFGNSLTLAKELSLALQFVSIQKDQFVELEKSDLPEKISAIYNSIQSSDFKNNNAFQATVYYGLESSSKTAAEIHKLIKYNDEADHATPQIIKPYKPQKRTEKEIVEKIKSKGYSKFSAYQHQLFWKTKWKNAADRNKKALEYGELVIKNQWLWYEDKWLPLVENYCKKGEDKFK